MIGKSMVKRYVVKTLRGTNMYPGFRMLFNLLGYARNYYLNRLFDKDETMRLCLQEHRAMALLPARETMVTFLDTYHEISVLPTFEFVRMYLKVSKESSCRTEEC